MNTSTKTKMTHRIVKGFIVTIAHRYREGTPETAAWLHSPVGVPLADGLWSGHLDSRIVAGSQVDAWIDAAQYDRHVGCGWALVDQEC